MKKLMILDQLHSHKIRFTDRFSMINLSDPASCDRHFYAHFNQAIALVIALSRSHKLVLFISLFCSGEVDSKQQLEFR